MINQYAIGLEYSTTDDGLTLSHSHRFRVSLADPQNPPAIGDDPATISLETNGLGGANGSIALDVGIAEYLSFFVPMFGANTNIQSISLLFYEFGLSSAGAYVSPINLSDPNITYATVGTNANDSTPASQAVSTFFDSRGKVSKLSLLEGRFVGSDQFGVNSLPAQQLAFVDYLTGANGFVKGSDNSRLLSLKLWSQGQNEKVWRNRYRS